MLNTVILWRYSPSNIPVIIATVLLCAIGCGIPDTSGESERSAETPTDNPTDQPLNPEQPEKPEEQSQATFKITSIDPGEGKTGGSELIVVEGKGFTEGMEVFFGSVPAASVSVLSGIVMHVQTPGHKPGLVDLTFNKPDGTSFTLESGFLFRDDLAIDKMEPASGSKFGGTPITIEGDGFTEQTRVLIGGRLAIDIEVLDRQTILALTPPSSTGASITNVIISTEWTNIELADGFRYTQAPTITAVSPVNAPVGALTEIEVTGTGFTADAVVTIGSQTATLVKFQDSNNVTISIKGQDVGPANVGVETTDGSGYLNNGFVFLDPNNEQFELLGVSPPAGKHSGGQTVTLTVQGLADTADYTVLFGKAEATIKSVSVLDSAIVVQVPKGSGTVDVTVQSDVDDEDTLENGYTFLKAAKINAVTPDTGSVSGGTKITITGNGFDEDSDVFIGALPAKIVSIYSNKIEAITPKGSPGSADVRISTANNEAVALNAFTYMPENGPELYAITPNYGAIAGNTYVRIYGAGLTPGAAINFGELAGAETNFESTTEYSVRAPKAENSGSVDVTLSLNGNAKTLYDAYHYFDPYSPYGGSWGPKINGAVNITVLNIYDTEPIPGTFVMLGNEGSTPHQGFTDDRGQITFSGPSLAGRQMVTAAKPNHSAYSVVEYDAENVTVHLIPFSPPSSGGGGGGTGLPFGEIRGKVLGMGKYIVVPPQSCEAIANKGQLGAAGSACTSCKTDADCNAGVCLDVASKGNYCVLPCESNSDCKTPGYVCGPAGNLQTACIPDPGEVAAYCQTTAHRLWEPPPTPHPFKSPEEDGTQAWVDDSNQYVMKTRLGELAVICVGGVIRDTAKPKSSFLPLVMGVRRHIEPVPAETVKDIDVMLDIPLKRNVPIRLDNPPLKHPATGVPTTINFKAALDFGAEGYWQLTDMTTTAKKDFLLKAQPTNLTGVLNDVTYSFLALVVADQSTSSGTQDHKVKVLEVDRMFAFENGEWNVVKSGIPRDVHAVFGSGPGNHWAVGANGLLAHAKNNDWFPQYSPVQSDLNAIFGSAEDHITAVGEKGAIIEFTGTLWSLADSPTTNDLFGLWGTAPDNMLAVGDHVVLHRNSINWTALEPSPPTILRSAWSDTPTTFVMVGDDGKLWRYDNSFKSEELGLNGIRLRAVGGLGNKSIWVAGDLGTVMEWTAEDGWKQHDIPTTEHLNGISVLASGHVFVAGDRGTLLHFDGSGWTVEKAPQYGGDLLAVWADDSKDTRCIAAGSQVVSLGPMLSFPIINDPMQQNTFTYHLDWTVMPGAMPTFNFVEMLYGGQMPLWWTVVESDTTDIQFPIIPQIQGFSPLPSGTPLEMVVNRVLKPGASVDNFDFWDTYTRGSWKSWATGKAPFVP